MDGTAIILTNGLLKTFYAKTCHGLLRGTRRYNILAVIDKSHSGKDAGISIGEETGINVYKNISTFRQEHKGGADYCIVGVAFEGGKMPIEFRDLLLEAISCKMNIVNGLHTLISEDIELMEAARLKKVQLIDIRKPKLIDDLHFWTGEIYNYDTPRIAILGMDCAVGKRTTTHLLWKFLASEGIHVEMIYTGQTGWLLGHKYGCILDCTLNDFVSGELEHAILSCIKNENPDLILVEGQSSLRNPSGPCGSELIISCDIPHVILQHMPDRTFYEAAEHLGKAIPSVQSEISLISALGAETIGVTLAGTQKPELVDKSIPIFNPVLDGFTALQAKLDEIMNQ